MKCVKCKQHQAPPGYDVCDICSVDEFTESQKRKKEHKMNEKRSELKVVWAALSIVAAQVLGIDVSALTSIIGTESTEILDTIKAANSGDGGMWAACLAGVYALGRSYLKGKVK